MKQTYEVTVAGKVIGEVKAKDLTCAARQARKEFWPVGETRFRFAVSIKRPMGERTK